MGKYPTQMLAKNSLKTFLTKQAVMDKKDTELAPLHYGCEHLQPG
jgi:hypothetical protein